MSYYYRWADQFQVNINQLSEWEKNLPPSHSLLLWILIENKIDNQEYYAWASKHYELPLVDPAFFETPLKHNFWEEVKNIYNWSADLLPLRIWDDSLFIGCIEPPEKKLDEALKSNTHLDIQYILCPAKGIQSFWQQFLNFEEQSQGSLDAPSVNLDFSQIITNPLLNESSSTSNDTTTAPPLEEIPPPPSIDEQLITHSSIKTISSQNTELTNVAISEIDPNAPAPNSEVEVQSLKGFASFAFSKTKKYYEKQILFLKKEDEFFPFYWSNQLKPNTEALQTPINTTDPNIFRIAYLTRKPFYGKVSPNFINDQFLSSWFNGACLQDVAVHPMTNQQGETIAILFALKRTDIHTRTYKILDDISNLCLKLIPALELLQRLNPTNLKSA